MIKNTTERTYWKSLDEISNLSAMTEEYSHNGLAEFTQSTNVEPGASTASGAGLTVNRRGFVGLLSASMALAATSCRRPDHKIIPTVKAVEYVTPGLPLHYTTVFSHGNVAHGLIVKSRDGRPIKIEGNPTHVVSGGASSAWIQGSLLALYDPDRMKHPFVNKGATSPDGRRKAPGYSSADTVIATIAAAVQKAQSGGKVTRIIIGEHASPSFAALTKEIETATGGVLKFVVMPALLSDAVAAANKLSVGVDGEFVVDYSKADVILSVDADFLGTDKNAIYNTRGFTSKRKPTVGNPVMNKLVVVESQMSLTGINADERIKAAPEEMIPFLAAVAKQLAAKTGKGGSVAAAASDAGLSELLKKSALAVADALHGAQGKAVVSVGNHLPLAAHILGTTINYMLGAFGSEKPIGYIQPYSSSKSSTIEAFREELKRGNVGVVVFGNVNPLYNGDETMKKLLLSVENKYACSLYEDETAVQCIGYIPTTHYLESWGDAVAFDGTHTIQQPLVAPLNANSLALEDILIRLTKAIKNDFLGETAAYVDFIRQRWEAKGWEEILRAGVYKQAGSSDFVLSITNLNEAEATNALRQYKPIERKGDFVVLVTPSYAQYDGSMANVSWFQELPDPVTKMTWDNAALVSKNTAAKILGEERANKLVKEYEKTELVKLTTEFGTVELPIWIQPGMQDNVIATTLGFGRTNVGVVANNVGANTYALMGAMQTTGYLPVKVELTGKKYKIATTQKHYDLIGRKIVQETTLAQIKSGDKELFEREEVPGKKKGDKSLPPSIMQSFVYKGHRWGMVIDMSACTGCGACIIACQAENNIPVVGKDYVANAREMHWIRIDRYYKGSIDDPETILQPMLCQHCESAPCENVCPVAATTHSPEGLNEMTYNRCVGTKYCANNCPYKVRRFNWLNFHKDKRTPVEFVYNPDVTMRARGVMEKCSFCVQRITEAKHKAKDEGRLYVNDGEVVTACQQACPASAIIFGNTNDPKSRVSEVREDERGFLVLEELNARPQVTYLAKVRNVQRSSEKATEKHS
jgi:molybdopterin-containing oxidoreductase family iron-sulfur binding subunit